ncbi:hypothetical protein H6F98_27510 [Microcoleus sp. FACHB-SPT15]|nr:hypothetical protein [Microcoleus sp. FACHB-SPT15]
MKCRFLGRGVGKNRDRIPCFFKPDSLSSKNSPYTDLIQRDTFLSPRFPKPR